MTCPSCQQRRTLAPPSEGKRGDWDGTDLSSLSRDLPPRQVLLVAAKQNHEARVGLASKVADPSLGFLWGDSVLEQKEGGRERRRTSNEGGEVMS